MKAPERFWPLFVRTFVVIVAIFVVFGVCGYLAYGKHTEAVLLTSMPQGPVMHAVRLLYIFALLAASPLVFIPGARITELWAFGQGASTSTSDKACAVNVLRLAEYALFAALAIFARASFETFLAVVGVVTGAPIAFIFPSYFYLKTMPKAALTPGKTAVAVGCLAFGVAAFGLIAWQTLTEPGL